MPKNRWMIAVASLMVCLPLCARGSAPQSRFFISHWDTGDGLPQNSVISTIQTRDGYLWLGTLDGLARFDGIHFETFTDANTPGLDSVRIVRLFEDSHTNLWIGTDDAGVFMVDPMGHVSRVELGPDFRETKLTTICEDSGGGVWLKTSYGSVYCYRYGRAVSILRGAPSLFTDASGKVWVSTLSTTSAQAKLLGLRLAPGSAPAVGAIEDELTIGTPHFLAPSRRGGYWLLANGRVEKYRGSQLERYAGTMPWSAEVNAACEDREGNLVVGTAGEGVFWFSAGGGGVQISSQGVLRFGADGVVDAGAHSQSGLTHNNILSLCMDREGSLWVGTDGGGLNRIRRQPFDAMEVGQNVTSVVEDHKGGLWLASGGALTHVQEGTRKTFGISTNLNPINSSVSAVYQDAEQNLWVGGTALAMAPNGRRVRLGPVFILDGDSLRPAQGLAAANWLGSVIYQDRAHRLWVSGTGGLAFRDHGKWSVLQARDGLSAESVDAIADDSEGNVWIGTQGGGLNGFRNGRFSVVTRTNGLPSDNISSLYVDGDGVLWAGTTGGLARFHRGKWTHYSKMQGLINERVGYTLEDGAGYLWLGSTAGLARVKKKELNDFAASGTNEIFFRFYGKPDGLPSAECAFGSQPAACRTRDGRLWFPTIKGLAIVDPAQLEANTNPPPVMIQSVFIGGDLQNTNALRSPSPTRITIPAGKESLEIHFASLNLSAPLQGNFKYRMQRHETKWTEKPGEVRFARYPRLPPGDYLFEVKAYNEDGFGGDSIATLAVKVLPPFWLTWWFKTATALIAVGFIIGSVYYASTQKLQRQVALLREQEALERERGRIARDLHDQLGANLTQVALLGELAETDKDSPADVEAHARQISQTARETTNALDEIVWTVNPSNDTLDGLINYVCKYAQEYLALAGLRYRLEVPSDLPHTPISPELRHNLFLAAKETINNVVKHAHATSAWLRLRLEPDRFTLEIEDDGRGLDADAHKKGRSGLQNLAKRMADIGGKFEITPRAGGGTVVRLTAPLQAEKE
jgi:signal transduction histidine kinase/ligand-binding sensor domain-containing protein